MRKGNKWMIFIGLISAVAAIVAALAAVLLYLDRKKDNEEMDRYLEGVIQ
jgi:hypothetical protein